MKDCCRATVEELLRSFRDLELRIQERRSKLERQPEPKDMKELAIRTGDEAYQDGSLAALRIVCNHLERDLGEKKTTWKN